MEFKFTEAETTACIICDHSMSKQRPILFISHEEDGLWQFLCGHDDHNEDNYKLISLSQATSIDPSINDVSDLPIGSFANRLTSSDNWRNVNDQ